MTHEQQIDCWRGRLIQTMSALKKQGLQARVEQRDTAIVTQSKRVNELETELALANTRAERLKLEAEGHAREARAQRATVQEIYQLITGATGEPGDWNGAEPVRKWMAERGAEISQLTTQRDLSDALFEKYRSEVQQDQKAQRAALDGLRVALLAQTPTPVSKCWCGGDRLIRIYGHEERCKKANAALEQANAALGAWEGK